MDNTLRNHRLAERLVNYFTRRNLFFEVSIYVNGDKWSSEKSPCSEERQTKKGCLYHYTPDVKIPTQYSNSETVTITFEGPLYHDINYGNGDTMKALDHMVAHLHLYFEQGEAWSMAAYEI